MLRTNTESIQKVDSLTSTDRITALDVIRGLALLGILIPNMPIFSSPDITPQDWWPAIWDQTALLLIGIFSSFTFNTMFAFLFGFGFTIFIERATQRGKRSVLLFIRRLLVLLGIGLIHSYFIWFGDILVYYSLIGFLLILFRNSKPKTLLLWAFSLLLIPIILLCVTLLDSISTTESAKVVIDSSYIRQIIQIYGHGTYSEIFAQNAKDAVKTLFGYFSLTPILFPMFLFGVYTSKIGIIKNVAQNLRWLQKVCICSLLVGVILLLPLLLRNDSVTASDMELLSLMASGPALCIFYMTGIILLSQKDFCRRLFSPLQAAGYLSLTNYLLQSIICTWIFYSYGLGWYGTIGPTLCILLAVVLFTVQVTFSNLWMKYFVIGPIEWVWRTLSYGNRPPFKKSVSRK